MKRFKIKRLSLLLIFSLAITTLPIGNGLASGVYAATDKTTSTAETLAETDPYAEIPGETPDNPGEIPTDPEVPPLPPEKQEQTITCAPSYTVKFGQNVSVNATADGGGIITYMSSNEEIFQVTPYGQLIPKKMGAATLTITASETETHKAAEKKVTVTVKTSLSTPKVTAREIIEGQMTLKWNPVNGAVKYEIYRKPANGTYQLMHTIRNGYTTSYSDTTIKQGIKYYYKITATAVNPEDYTSSLGYSMVWLYTPKVHIGSNAHRIQVNWNKIKYAGGYYVYRKLSTESQWKELAKVSGGGVTSYHDATAKNGKTYDYAVKAYYVTSMGAKSKSAAAYRFAAPTSVDWSVADANSRRLKWTKNSAADGYEIQYANNRLFINASTLTVSKQTSEKIIAGISYKKTAFARIRAYKNKNGKKIYSSWQECKTAAAEGFATIKRTEIKDKPLELRELSGQIMYKNDTVQGGCTDGTYAYYRMYDRGRENAKVIKMRLSDNTFVKASKVLPIDHGNSITYNSKTKKLVVTYTTDHLKRMAIINPNTLVLEKSFDVKFADNLNGKFFNTDEKMGFSSIAYNPSRDVYVAVTKGTRGFAILDNNFNIREYIPFSARDEGYLWQNIDCTDEYITVVKSPIAGSGKTYNLLAIYDWDGRFVTNFNLAAGLELENVFHIGTKYYMSLYKAYYNEKGIYCRDSYVYNFNLDEEDLSLKSFVVIPGKPYKLSLTNGKKQIKLKWSKVTNADGYKIYYKTSKTGSYKLLKTVYGGYTDTYTHKALKAGKTYYYKVKSFTKTDGKYYYSPYTSEKYMKAKSK